MPAATILPLTWTATPPYASSPPTRWKIVTTLQALKPQVAGTIETYKSRN